MGHDSTSADASSHRQDLGQEWWWQSLLGLIVQQKTQLKEESAEINAAVSATALKASLRRGIYGVYCIFFGCWSFCHTAKSICKVRTISGDVRDQSPALLVKKL